MTLKELHPQLITRGIQLGLSSQDAEDLAQNIWLKLAARQKLSTVLEMSNAGGYLHTMLRNTIRSHWRDQRRLKRGGNLTHETLEDIQVEDHTPPPDEQLALKEIRAALTSIGANDRTPNGPADRVRLHRQRLAWREQLRKMGITPRYSRPRP